ncbi:MAG: DNA polymerase III subunit beta, partial [Acutalibacteraceae bacterium]|nr:DNA polymerase III subunit beta [Acutalibacteraceae bacterium]
VERLASPVRCIFEDDTIYLKCETSVGKASDNIDCSIDGEQLEIGFNSRYMIETLRAIEDEQIKIVFGGPNQAIRIIPVEGESFHYLIMPIRLKENR